MQKSTPIDRHFDLYVNEKNDPIMHLIRITDTSSFNTSLLCAGVLFIACQLRGMMIAGLGGCPLCFCCVHISGLCPANVTLNPLPVVWCDNGCRVLIAITFHHCCCSTSTWADSGLCFDRAITSSSSSRGYSICISLIMGLSFTSAGDGVRSFLSSIVAG